MRRTCTALALAGGIALAVATPAMADGFQTYRVCGGDQFKTCAAVELSVVGANVTMKVWNLSGFNGSGAGTVFTGFGFYNLPAGISYVGGSGNVSGPARPGDTPGNWTFKNDGRVNFPVDIDAGTPGKNEQMVNGIASACATPGQLPGSPPNLYMNPCSSDTSDPAGWVTFTFQISGGTWDPTTSHLVIRGYDALTDTATECWTGPTPNGTPTNCPEFTAVPEPVTMTLLATGLAGMSGVKFFRRRKDPEDVS